VAANDLRLPQDKALALVQYLVSQPFGEVHQLVALLHQLEEVGEVKKRRAKKG